MRHVVGSVVEVHVSVGQVYINGECTELLNSRPLVVTGQDGVIIAR